MTPSLFYICALFGLAAHDVFVFMRIGQQFEAAIQSGRSAAPQVKVSLLIIFRIIVLVGTAFLIANGGHKP